MAGQPQRVTFVQHAHREQFRPFRGVFGLFGEDMVEGNSGGI